MISKEEFNERVLQDIGLEVEDDGTIVDDETGDTIQFKGKTIKVNNIGQNDIEFDPIENPSMMSKLFTYFLAKNEKETGVGTRTFAYSNSNKKDKSYIELKKEDNTVVRSNSYFNDSLKYADIIFKMNSNVYDEDLSPLDSLKKKGRR